MFFEVSFRRPEQPDVERREVSTLRGMVDVFPLARATRAGRHCLEGPLRVGSLLRPALVPRKLTSQLLREQFILSRVGKRADGTW